MKRVIIVVGLILIFLTNVYSQETMQQIIPPENVPAYDIQVICTDPVGCQAPYRVTAFGPATKEWITDINGYVVAHFSGLPSHDENGNLLWYYIMARPVGYEIPCMIIYRPYPTGSLYLEIELTGGPCNMF